MLETLRNDSEGQRLHFGNRLVPVLPIAQHTGQGSHLGQPAAVGLAIQFDGERHPRTVYPLSAANKRVRTKAAVPRNAISCAP